MASKDVDMMCFGSHAVPDFDAWYVEFKKAIADPKMATDLGIAKSFACKCNEPNKDGKTVIQVVHFFSSDKLEAIKKFHDFTGPPFVGGPDLIKNGIVIPPISCTFGTLKSEVSSGTILDANEPMSMSICMHGVPNFQDAMKSFRGAADFITSLGVTTSWVGTELGTDRWIVIELFRTSMLEKFQESMKFDAPPFVGGPDLIKNGIIIKPIDVVLSQVVGEAFQSMETKQVILPPTQV